MNKNEGYMCGMLCGRGFVTMDERHGNYSIGMESKEGVLVELFADAVFFVFGKKPRIYIKIRRDKNGAYRVFSAVLYGKKFLSYVINLGLNVGVYHWDVPKQAAADGVFRTAFLQGFFDAVGSVRLYRLDRKKLLPSSKRSIKITSVNNIGLAKIKELLKLDGILCSIRKSKKYACLEISGKSRLKMFRDKIGFRLPKKNALLNNAINFFNKEQ